MAGVRRYQVADVSGDTTNNHGDIYLGDPVTLNGSGLVTVANSGDTILGVVVGVGKAGTFDVAAPFNPDNLTERFVRLEDTGTETYFVWISPAESAMFEAQSDSDLDLAIGAAADITTEPGTAHGSRLTGNSTAEIAANVNDDVRVIQIPAYPDNDPTLANTRYHVTFTNRQFLAAIP
jgi:hypothetical protein